MDIIHTDCLVVGAGLAGSAYALHAAQAGLDVQLLSQGGPYQANSNQAQGGIIYDTSDQTDLLAQDILNASDGTANPAAVDQLVQSGPAAVRELLLDQLNVDFDRQQDGDLDLAREGGHSSRRIIHARDLTGHAILSAVAASVNTESRITQQSGSVAIDLLTLSHNTDTPADRYAPLTCFGAYVLNEDSDDPVAIVARKTILATGGLGQIFQYSTNYPGTIGHGVAMAYRVGARVIDLEYVQFHPTVFYSKNSPSFLITEALRGEGAVLINAQGEPFMEAVHPRGSLAPRDIVSRAIHQQMVASGDPCVYLDLASLKADFIKDRFPFIYRRCSENGIDITSEPIPVVPAAHYSCGGVHTDLNGRTNVQGLNAIGESACTGLHGANRLASTSLLECLTGAKFTAMADALDLKEQDFRLPDPRPWKSPLRDADPTLIQQDLNLVQQTMWNYAGIIRSKSRLTRARRILLELREEVSFFYRDCRLSRELIELRNAVQTALLVVHAANLNPESKGSHFVSRD
jgi:L-aspartate oxidase